MAGENLLEYKGYVGKVSFDSDEGVLHGEVINTRDGITFQGESVPELRSAFHESVDAYLQFCAEQNRKPNKPFSGKFLVRLEPELHRLISLLAQAEDVSLNHWVSEALKRAAMSHGGALVEAGLALPDIWEALNDLIDPEMFIPEPGARTPAHSMLPPVYAYQPEMGVYSSESAGPVYRAQLSEGEYDVVLKEMGPKKIQVIKAIRELTNLGLRESKEMAETEGSTVLRSVSQQAAIVARQRLEAAGASVELVGYSAPVAGA